jgi:hypothetical protein
MLNPIEKYNSNDFTIYIVSVIYRHVQKTNSQMLTVKCTTCTYFLLNGNHITIKSRPLLSIFLFRSDIQDSQEQWTIDFRPN